MRYTRIRVCLAIVAVAFVGLVLYWYVTPGGRQHRQVSALRRAGAAVRYDFLFDKDLRRIAGDNEMEGKPFIDWYADVVQVHLYDAALDRKTLGRLKSFSELLPSMAFARSLIPAARSLRRRTLTALRRASREVWQSHSSLSRTSQ
jgi:hypothetical protein